MSQWHNRNSHQKRELREEARRRQRNRCWYCAGQMRTPTRGRLTYHPEDATVAHVQDLADGGTWHRSNIRAAHRRCNEAAGRERETQRRRS